MRQPLVLILLLLVPAFAEAQSVLVVRHAERADAGMAAGSSTDPELSAAGHARAQALALVLKDAAISRIYVSEFKRTRQTAEPLAASTGIGATTVSAREVQALLAQVKAGRGNALIVAHSNTIPDILKGLGVAEPVVIGDTEHDNLFIVAGGGAAFVRLRYR